jgi:hypothetical protein
MPQRYSYRGYEIELKETGESFVALFKTSPLERPVTLVVSATVPEGMEALRQRVRLLIDFELDRERTSR